MPVRRLSGFLVLWPVALLTQTVSAQTNQLSQALDRLDRLEAQNRELTSEIKALREQLAALGAATASAAPVQEALEVQQTRIGELAETKVGTDHRFPVTLTGTVLFNAYLNGRGSGGAAYPTVAPLKGGGSGGASLRQTILGLKFQGPELPGGGKMSGSVYMDFFGGDAGLQQGLRLRVASLNADWKSRSLTFAFDKPLIAMRDPDSLAQVGVSPLTAAGNLWLWRPQVRFEQRLSLGEQAGIRAQASMLQTAEGGTGLADDYGETLAESRPGYEGRVEVWAQRGARRLEIAPGFHASSTRILGRSVESRIFAVDWLIRPVSRIDFTGTFFNGQNVGIIGGLRQGVTVYRNGVPVAVGSTGGWAQAKYRITPKLTFNAFAGLQDDEDRRLERGHSSITRNLSFGGNLMYRLSSNVMTGIEASQVRTHYLESGLRLNQHYDVAIAYMF